MLVQQIPTPTFSKLEVGPLTIYIYALCIIAGVAIAIWLGDKRFRKLGPGLENVVADVAIFAVPAGVVGGRIYHLISSPDDYFGEGGNPLDALKIWEGGLGIWGAIALGTFASWIVYRREAKKKSLPQFRYFLDSLAPGILFAQALGRFGNWFNGELFGRPLQSWWALEIPIQLRPQGFQEFATFHPTFLYEALWTSSIAITLLVLTPRLTPGSGFALYVGAYSFGRFFIESIRIDQAHLIAGMRVNQWVALILFVGAGVAFRRLARQVR
jgi:prolipoprotein diacylglyceryl transferase